MYFTTVWYVTRIVGDNLVQIVTSRFNKDDAIAALQKNKERCEEACGMKLRYMLTENSARATDIAIKRDILQRIAPAPVQLEARIEDDPYYAEVY